MAKKLNRSLVIFIVLLTCFMFYDNGLTFSENNSVSLSINTTPKIAFVSDRDSFTTNDIFVMNADGSNLQNITNHRAEDYTPSWSPDGSKILFKRYNPGDSYSYIYVMNADGTGLTQILESIHYHAWFPVWSPDGSKISYQLFSGEVNYENFSIWVMNTDGTQNTQLTNHPGNDTHPTWSPDGEQIAFSRDWNDNSEIYVINIDGSGEKNLTNNPAQDYDPDFSHDGSKIAFVSDRDKPSGIWVMNSDGSNPKIISKMKKDLGNDDSDPDWSADGSRIVFKSWRNYKWEIFVMNADGSCQVRLTEFSVYSSGSGDKSPVWQPGIPDSPLPYFCLYEPITIK